MGYLFYSITFLFLVTATGILSSISPCTYIPLTPSPALYLTKHLWISHAPPIPYLTAPGHIPEPLWRLAQSIQRLNPFAQNAYISLGQNSFEDDMEAGFSSANFDLRENVESGDSRQGLDEQGKARVKAIMKSRGCGFDEARRIVMEEKFGRENIGKDGRPRDPKAVMFDRL
ncbi:hypothetical protein E4T39_01392 [Aureobasidium subglaciale]|nr:hypothetical protein E4T39_01392 [Aureobasidium subglaciale]